MNFSGNFHGKFPAITALYATLPLDFLSTNLLTDMLPEYVPNAQNPFDYSKAAHLLRRAMTGPKHEEILEAVQKGFHATVDSLFTLHYPSAEYISEWADKDTQSVSPIDDTEYAKWYWAHFGRNLMFHQWQIMNIRDSPVSLQERLVLFWQNHFATDVRMNIQYANILYTQYRLFQKMCMGNFKEFVKLTMRNQALQLCLTLHDNYVHEGRKYINENYAREMMELHTVGVFDENGKANYTQHDVYEAARAMTGWFWEFSDPEKMHVNPQSINIPNRFDATEKVFLGRNGVWNGDDIIDILFEEKSRQIARRICTKLYEYYLDDIPDVNAVESMADIFISSGWELIPPINLLLKSEHFYRPESMGALKKSHIEYISGMIRQMSLSNIPDFDKNQDRPGDLIIRLQGLGQLMYYPPNVSGWPGKRDWVNSTVLPHRLQFAADVAKNTLYALSYPYPPSIYNYDPAAFAHRFESWSNPRKLASDMANFLLPVPVGESEMQSYITAILDGGAEYEWDYNNPKHRVKERIRQCIVIIVSHPAFQLL